MGLYVPPHPPKKKVKIAPFSEAFVVLSPLSKGDDGVAHKNYNATAIATIVESYGLQTTKIELVKAIQVAAANYHDWHANNYLTVWGLGGKGDISSLYSAS